MHGCSLPLFCVHTLTFLNWSINFCTIRFSACRCATACLQAGIEFLDAPISGGPTKAKDGTLTIMCGGPEKVFNSVLPVLQCMGSHVKHMGPHGAGTATKLVMPFFLHSLCVCLCLQYLIIGFTSSKQAARLTNVLMHAKLLNCLHVCVSGTQALAACCRLFRCKSHVHSHRSDSPNAIKP